MATPAHRVESKRIAATSGSIWDALDLDDDRIMIDIETERLIRSQMQSTQSRFVHRIPHFLLEGRTLGPLAVLLILGLYSLLSPLLSPAIHEYIYHILH